ncbi:MAG: nucleotide sugar dehydrogenase [Candidatus Hodarchaeota archaeon]
MASLKEKIDNKSAVIAVLGLGYVGYPIASLFSNAGFRVIGYDVDISKVNVLGKRVNINGYAPDINFIASNNSDILSKAEIYIIVVPTPLTKNDIPDMSYVISASETIAKTLAKGKLVILVSTTYPDTTEKVVKPILEKTGLIAGEDFYLCYCPERYSPGNPMMRIENIPHLVSGIDEESKELAFNLYAKILDQKNVIPVSSLKIAEASKILENVFRNVNVALINEIAKVFEKMEIDTWEVIQAASTKPGGFLAHYPGPGVGGHCIPLDPYYLYYIAMKYGMNCQFIQLAGEINRSMPYHIVYLIEEILKKVGKTLRFSKVSILGVTYKPNVDDTRESPTEVIIKELIQSGVDVTVFDPYTTESFGGRLAKNIEQAIKGQDCVALIVSHDKFHNIEEIININNPNICIVDAKNTINPNLLKSTVKYRCLGKGSK